MTVDRTYPDEPAGPFPTPPVSRTDREGREIELRPYGEGDREALQRMYVSFDPEDRAQGIPPTEEGRVESWLENVLCADCLNVLAWHGDSVAGHAMLVPDRDDYELAIFVLQEYQEAGIGTMLMETLLGYGGEHGIEHVWLTVERWNEPAIRLYRKVGFETTGKESFELEMGIQLDRETSVGEASEQANADGDP